MSLFLGKAVIIPLYMDLRIHFPMRVNHNTPSLCRASLLLFCVSWSVFITTELRTALICTTGFLSENGEGLRRFGFSATCTYNESCHIRQDRRRNGT